MSSFFRMKWQKIGTAKKNRRKLRIIWNEQAVESSQVSHQIWKCIRTTFNFIKMIVCLTFFLYMPSRCRCSRLKTLSRKFHGSNYILMWANEWLSDGSYSLAISSPTLDGVWFNFEFVLNQKQCQTRPVQQHPHVAGMKSAICICCLWKLYDFFLKWKTWWCVTKRCKWWNNGIFSF